MKIKICGLTKEEDIHIVNKYKPDYIGFVFANSKRQINKKTAKELKNGIKSDIQAVGVFADQAMDNIIELVNEGIIDLIQLHGKEDEDYIRRLKQRTGVPVIKAVKVSEDKRELYINTEADYILLDSGAGSGCSFDWNRKIICNRPVFLAGGLNGENVTEAISKVKPYGVDVSSGVETEGKKDKVKIRKFIEESRRIYE